MYRCQGDYWEDLAADRRLVCQTMMCFLRQVDTMKSLYSLRGTTNNVFELGFVFIQALDRGVKMVCTVQSDELLK